MSYFTPGLTHRFAPALSLFLFALVLGACSSNNDSPAPVANGTSSTPTAKITNVAVALSAAQEVPPVAENAKGEGGLKLNEASGELSGSVTISGLSGVATAAHIHAGEAGANGGIVIGLVKRDGNGSQWDVPDGTVLTSGQVSDLLAGKMYVNVHTDTYPTGEIRGQILPANIKLVRVVLNGESEVPPVNSAAAGVAYITARTVGDRGVLGNIRTTGLPDATAAHIHAGFAGENGGIAIAFERDAADPSFWHLPAAAKLTAGQLEALLSGGLYINMHSPAHPPGELRGQIYVDGVTVIHSTLNGSFEVPKNNSAGTAIAWLTIKKETGALHANLHTRNLPDASAAHIHAGVVGRNGGIVVGLAQDKTDTTLWSTAVGAVLSQEQIKALEAGGLYYNVHTATTPAGEIRGQIVP